MLKNEWRVPNAEDASALLLVAHPDDEIIFCGGMMLTHPNWRWTVVCLTHSMESSDQYSQIRSSQFRRAMEAFRHKGVEIAVYKDLGQEDKDKNITQNDTLRWKDAILGLEISPDIVFTHNSRGEYGHEQHIAVNKIAKECFSNVWEFICPGATNALPQPQGLLVNEINLSLGFLEKKKEIFNNNYVSEWGLWTGLSDVMKYEFEVGPEIFTADES